jgi:integrase
MGHKRERLSALALSRLAKTPGVYPDGGGLNLKVRSETAASWTYRFMINRVAREMGLGKYPDVSLARARELAVEVRGMKATGKNPIVERARANAMSFRACAEQYIADRRDGWKSAKHAEQWTATLREYVYPKFGEMPVGAVDTALVVAVLKPIWLAKPETAKRVRGRIEAILDWAKAHGFRSGGENPARRGYLKNLLPAQSKNVTHHAALPLPELPAFMAKLRTHAGVGARALEFAILTAARTGEVIGARWSEIDAKEKTWTVPAERMKSGVEHRVPLSARAIEILTAIKPANPDGEAFVFPGAGLGRPLSNMAMLQLLKRMGRDGLTTHGFRSTFRDWSGEAGFSREVAEAALVHVVDDKVEAAYLRTTFFDRRRKLMDAWAEACSAAASKAANVVSLHGESVA